MADQAHKDIYSERERNRGFAEDQGPGEADERWLRSTTRSVWSSVVLVVVLLLFLGVMGLVIYLQHNMLKEARERQRDEAVPIEVRTVPRTGGVSLDMDPTGRLILDEFEPLPSDETLSAGAPRRLNARLVQQAAFHLRQAERSYREENWPAALDSFREALKIIPDMDGVQEQMGLCHLRQKDFAKAEEVFAESVRRVTNSAPLLNNLAVARMGDGDHAKAEQDLLKAIALDPGYGPARHNLGLLYYRTGSMDKAAQAFAQCVKVDPSNAEVAHMYAVALMKLERWPEAAAVLQESATRAPQAAPILFRLAEARSHTKDTAGAIKALKSAIELVDVRTAMVWLNRKEFDLLRGRPEFQEIVMELTKPMR